MSYENPLYLAEEAAALDLIADALPSTLIKQLTRTVPSRRLTPSS